jgi:hypothetical protein
VAGSSNGRWKGGRTRHKAGYVMMWAAEMSDLIIDGFDQRIPVEISD